MWFKKNSRSILVFTMASTIIGGFGCSQDDRLDRLSDQRSVEQRPEEIQVEILLQDSRKNEVTSASQAPATETMSNYQDTSMTTAPATMRTAAMPTAATNVQNCNPRIQVAGCVDGGYAGYGAGYAGGFPGAGIGGPIGAGIGAGVIGDGLIGDGLGLPFAGGLAPIGIPVGGPFYGPGYPFLVDDVIIEDDFRDRRDRRDDDDEDFNDDDGDDEGPVR